MEKEKMKKIFNKKEMKKKLPKWINNDTITIFIAFLALFLSQLKPLYEYFQSYKLEYSLPNSIIIYSYLGLPMITMEFGIQNVGEKVGKISNIDVIVYNESTDETILLDYVRNPEEIPNTHNRHYKEISELYLKPKEEKNYILNFSNWNLIDKVTRINFDLFNEVDLYDILPKTITDSLLLEAITLQMMYSSNNMGSMKAYYGEIFKRLKGEGRLKPISDFFNNNKFFREGAYIIGFFCSEYESEYKLVASCKMELDSSHIEHIYSNPYNSYDYDVILAMNLFDIAPSPTLRIKIDKDISKIQNGKLTNIFLRK